MRHAVLVGTLLVTRVAAAQPDPAPPPPPPTEPAQPAEPAPVAEPAEPAPVVAPPSEAPPVEVAAPAPAPAPPPPPPVETGYPLALPARPLVMPSGMVELVASSTLTDAPYEQDPIDGMVSARAGVAGFELEGGVTIHLRDISDEGAPDKLALAMAGVRYGVSPDVSVGVEGRLYQPTDEYSQTDIRVGIAGKFHLSDRAAIEGRAAVAYTKLSSDFGSSVDDDLIYVVTQGRIEVAMTPELSAEAIADVYIYPEASYVPSYVAIQPGLRALYAASAHADIFAETHLYDSSFGDINLFTLGIQGRLP